MPLTPEMVAALLLANTKLQRGWTPLFLAQVGGQEHGAVARGARALVLLRWGTSYGFGRTTTSVKI